MRISVDDAVVAAFPDFEIRLVTATGVRNREVWPHLDAELAELEGLVESGRFAAPTEDEEAISSWFAAFRSFGTNPRRMRPSVYALLRRLAGSGRLPRITPAVDAYNLVSIRHRVPAGAFDLAKLPGPIEIRLARAGDSFTPLGEPDSVEQPRPGEVVYAAGSEVLTRHWNYRDSERTKVDEDSTAIVFVLERVAASRALTKAVAAAGEELAELVAPFAEQVSVRSLTPQSPAAELAG
ncbi:B3/B4 domain-containing protein [Jatrophihabitans sp.]|uniref:B3/B4 domain-containing protein n=1 Tax=Jatrophihabitans sp. TaxID=1932789 RepID=UPI002C2A7E83|nr:phenylalanine--tRNA ligase beta subunit-related protein [Jatrophihabitans sp.]